MTTENLKEIRAAVERPSKQEFIDGLFCIVTRRKEFSRLMCLGLSRITDYEKRQIRVAMIENGIPSELIASDESLDAAAQLIMARAVTVS